MYVRKRPILNLYVYSEFAVEPPNHFITNVKILDCRLISLVTVNNLRPANALSARQT